MSRSTLGRPLSVIFDQIARATSSRGASSSTKRSPSASRRVAPSPRIASVTRKPSRPLTPVTAVGWNCMSSRSASAAPAPRASSSADAERAGRVGRALPQGGRAAGGEDDRRGRGWRGRPRRRRRRSARRGTHSVAARAPSMTVTPGRLDHDGGELAHDAPAGRAAAGVDDAPARVAALEAEREVAVAVGVEVHAEALEVAHGARRLAAQDGRGARAHQVAPGALGVLAVQVGRVVRRQRRRQAALGPVARGARERRGGDERDARAGAGRGQRGVEARGAGADDDQVGLDARGAGHARVP